MKKIKTFENFEDNEELKETEMDSNNPLDFWIKKFGIGITEAEDLEELLDEISSMDDIDERMDAVEQFNFSGLTDDEDVAEEIEMYFKDNFVI
jgi:hypothetical protein